MTLSDDSVSRENLLYYLDCMEAPDDEADGTVDSYVAYKLSPKPLSVEDLTSTYSNKRSSK